MSSKQDVPGRIASGLRGAWGIYDRYNTAINGVLTATSVVVAILAVMSPSALNGLGDLALVIWFSDGVHTLLLLLIVLLLVTSSPTSEGKTARTDGGTRDAVPMTVAAILMMVAVGMLFGGIGDEWVIPGMLFGLTIFLWLTSS